MGHIFAKRIKLSGGHYTVTLPVDTTIKPGVHVTFAIITHEKIPATGNRRRNFSHFPFGVGMLAEGELASHGHSFILDSPQNGTASSSKGAWYVDAGTKGKDDTAYIVRTTQNTGANQPHNTIQPIYGVYKFRRLT